MMEFHIDTEPVEIPEDILAQRRRVDFSGVDFVDFHQEKNDLVSSVHIQQPDKEQRSHSKGRHAESLQTRAHQSKQLFR
jgi:hypothetical protein